MLLIKPQKQHIIYEEPNIKEMGSSSSKCNKIASFETVVEHEQPRIPPIRREYSHFNFCIMFLASKVELCITLNLNKQSGNY